MIAIKTVETRTTAIAVLLAFLISWSPSQIEIRNPATSLLALIIPVCCIVRERATSCAPSFTKQSLYAGCRHDFGITLFIGAGSAGTLHDA
jgi:hypothetical protein